jgi:hypothetical protein
VSVVVRICFLAISLPLALERAASACPFCGGRGASGLLENLLLVAGLWWGARSLLRSIQRRRLRERPSEHEGPDAP